MTQKALSMLLPHEMDAWMRPVWSDIRGASLRDGHPAPFPVEMAERLIRMFSFAGDTVLDPFGGSGSTALGAIASGRSSISIEIEPAYTAISLGRMVQAARSARLWGPKHHEVTERPPALNAAHRELREAAA
jgi:site-specific DNA-methyltransferase (adenine-specific)